jgi:hypothetical protein
VTKPRHPESALAPLWPPLPALGDRLTDDHGVEWRVEWRSEDGNVARLRAVNSAIVRSVTRERVADWRREP